MAVLSADTTKRLRSNIGLAFKIADTQVLFQGSYLGGRDVTFATVADRGHIDVWDGAAGSVPLGGFHRNSKATGDTDAPTTLQKPVPESQINEEGVTQFDVSVAGVASIADLFKLVYLDDNDNDLTLTRPTRGIPVGIIVRYHTGSRCDVRLFGFDVLVAFALSGSASGLMYLGHYDADTITAADLRTGIPMPYRGAFKGLFAMIDLPITGAGGTADINLEIDGTNVTGGVVTVSTAAGGTKGTKLTGTAITAAADFSEGSLLDIEAATVTDMTAGTFDLYAQVELKPGI